MSTVGLLVVASTSALASATEGADVFAQVMESRGVVFAVLLVLVALSVVSWFIIGLKTAAIARATKKSRSFVVLFREATRLVEFYQDTDSLPASPAREMFRAGYEELDLILRERSGRRERPKGDGPAAAPESSSAAFENIARSLGQANAQANARLEYSVSFLATVGSAAPFIGLFGTVWGIMNAFAFIDPSRPILETVTPHIAQALVATAIGLLAAVPAVMAYNWLLGRLRTLQVLLDDFTADYLNLLRRHFFS